MRYRVMFESNVDTISSMPLAAGESPETIRLESTNADALKFLYASLSVLWKDWPRDMRVTRLDDGFGFSLSGTCPHYRDRSVFMVVGSPLIESLAPGVHRVAAAMRCQGCLKFILGIVLRGSDGSWNYEEHYPIGAPDDSVDDNVPVPIAADFSEALRCLWVKAYKATVAMCRRSVEASCKDLNAQGNSLFAKIDDLAKKGVITEPLRQMAHAVRLTANRELHGEVDDLATITPGDAEAIIAFTKEYFHHVYVMPAKLVAFGKPAAKGEAALPEINGETKDLLGI
jgi:hypothetical protein